LERDSYINCSEAIDCLDEAEIKAQILADVGRIKGELNAASRRAIIQAVQSARTISARHKRLIADSLK